MPENFYHTLLGLDPEVVSPDYYQLLQMENVTEFTSEVIEEHYREQITKTQKVTSPRYKNLIEFLKGELRTARTSLSDEKLRKKYDAERKADAKAKLREIVIMFVQISGNLSDIEIGEIKRRGKVMNYPERDCDALIDEILIEFGLKRVQASPEQMKRASEILKKRGALSGAVAQVAASGATAGGRVSGKQVAVKLDAVDVMTAAAGGTATGTSGAKPKVGEVDLDAEAERLKKEAEFRKKYAGYLKLARLGATGLAVFGGVALVLVLLDLLGLGIIGPMFGGGAAEIKKARSETQQAKELLATAEIAKQAAEKRIKDLEGEKTPLQQAQIALGEYRLDDATQIAAANTNSTEVLKFIQRQLMPTKLQFAPQWVWDFSVTHPDFTHDMFKPSATGLQVEVTGRALEWPFGGAFKAGIVELDGEWTAKNGPLTLAFLQGNTDHPAVMGELTVDPALSELKLNLLDSQGVPVTLENSEKWTGTATAERFTLRLMVTKTDLSPTQMGTRIVGMYEQPGVSPVRVSTTTQIQRDGRREWVAGSAVGRLGFVFKPGCKVVLKKLVVR